MKGLDKEYGRTTCFSASVHVALNMASLLGKLLGLEPDSRAHPQLAVELRRDR